MRYGFLLFVLLRLWGPESGICARLSLPGQTAAPGQMVIAFAADGESISGIQLDIELDASLDVRFLPGPQVGLSTKFLYTNPIFGHTVRLLIAGINRNFLADGDMVRVFVSVVPNAPPGAALLRVSNIVATDPDGAPVSVEQPDAATIQIPSGGGIQPIQPTGVLHAATFAEGPVCPGEVITLFVNQRVTALRFNGTPAPVLYSAGNQVNAVVPVGLDLNAPAVMEVRNDDRAITTLTVPVAGTVPGIFTHWGTGIGPGAILNQDSTLNSFTNPAQPGSVIAVFGTGFGPLQVPGADGALATEAVFTVLPVTATVGGIPAEVTYAGAAPGLVNGVVQVNVRIPNEISPSPAAPILLSAGSATTPAGVTVSVQ